VISLKKFLGLGDADAESAESDSRTETIRTIARELEGLPQERAKYLAAFAALLSRAALADSAIADEEVSEMERLVAERGGLPEEQAVLVVQMAKTHALLLGGTEKFYVSQEFVSLTDRDQRLALIDCLFAVAAAEGGVSVVEENEIRRVSHELQLEHRDYITVRSKYRDSLNVLR
jgi:uncharacterized tellurite resistance protein B-like protein